MVLSASRRLPGLRFEFQPPPPTDVLPRMDVTIFVGFAASGPLHMPVAVEDVTQFTTIFGSDLPLAWDHQRGEQVYAYLAPTVRAFFRNGGLRCWIVRVAGDAAQYNYFPVPGLALVDEIGNLTPAFARARSQGSWSDGLAVSSSLITNPININLLSPSPTSEGLIVDLAERSLNDLAVGNLVRVTFTEGHVLMFSVVSAKPISSFPLDSPPNNLVAQSVNLSSPDLLMNGNVLEITTRAICWFTTNPPGSPLPGPTQVIMFTHNAERPPIHQVNNYREQDGVITIDLGVSLKDAPEPGSLIRVDFETDQLWLTVQTVGIIQDTNSPPSEMVEVKGQGLWALKQAPKPWPSFIQYAEKLSFMLWVRQGDGNPVALGDLTFSIDHPQFWKALPTDEQLYHNAQATSNPEHSVVWKEVSQTPYTALWSSAANPRFPLAGDDAPGEVYVPLAMPITPSYFLSVESLPAMPRPRVRDGLEEFHVSLFLDERMIEVLTTDLLAQANYLRYQAAEPGSSEDIQFRTLKGIYAALDVEEASLIAVPDALQRGWRPAFIVDPVPPQVSQPLPHPEWWHCQRDEKSDDLQTVLKLQQGTFHNCDMRVIESPDCLSIAHGPDQFGTFTLDWRPKNKTPGRYILEEALRADWKGAVVVYQGTEPYVTLYGRGQGNYYYRVRVEVAGDTPKQTPITSDWSSGIVVPIAATDRWQLKAAEEYDEQGLLALQLALVRLCAARGDLLAIIALPEHYAADDVIAHVARLKATRRPIELHSPTSSISDEVRLVFPLGFGERNAFSYAALYYPWLIVREDIHTNALKRIPPDGTACGVMAQRAINRGAWVAPANELLTGIAALTPPIGSSSWQRLQDTQINLIRQEPRGFLALSADTLCDEEDADVRPINVRRLLILLRRLALRLGATYVFEPNSDVFRRLVQRDFEAMLDSMFIRGAFAGSTPETSFQVVTDTLLNTPQSVEQGRFIVELRVAPSLPMTFLTIRLVQNATNGLVTEAR